MGHSLTPVRIELAADATWPAEESTPLGPWQLRATRGYSHRANSVRTAAENSTPSDWPYLIRRAEAFYRSRRLPTIFHISAATMPADVDEVLAKRGFRIEKPSEVWFADPEKARDLTAGSNSTARVVRLDAPDDPWIRCALDESIGRAEIREQICRRIPSPRVFALIVEQDQSIARALSAVHSGIGWLYCMATAPARQRHGHAIRLVHCLADWSIANGAETLCLQVMADNPAAKALYSRAGFQKQYDYHYRVRR